jgi:hypothetical protein
VEGLKRAWVWEMDNNIVDLQEIGRLSFDFAQDMDRWWDIRNLLKKFLVS